MVKKYFGKTSGNPVFHFVVVYNAKNTWGDNYERAEYFSRSIAMYFADRYQLVYCVHKKPCSKKNGGCGKERDVEISRLLIGSKDKQILRFYMRVY